MNDEPEQRTEPDEPAAPGAEQPVTTWTEPATSTAWTELQGEPETPADSGPTPGSSGEQGRFRRPSSLRAEGAGAPRFPNAPSFKGPPVSASGSSTQTPPVSEPRREGKPRPMPGSNSILKQLPLDKLPLDKLPLDKLPVDKLSVDKLPVDKLPVDQLPLAVDRVKKLVRERPEVGVGLAFAGGLVLASILRRLAR